MSYARRSSKVIEQLPIDWKEDESNSVTYMASAIEDVEDEPYVEVVSVVLCRHKIVNVIGKVTGRKYVFSGAGSIVDDVDIRDAQLMVDAPLTISCCGSTSTAQFQILGR